MSSPSSSSRRPDARRRWWWWWAVPVVVSALVATGACSAVQVDEAASDGTIAVGDLDATVADVECGAIGETLHIGGVAPLSDDREERIGVFDVTVEGETAQAVVRTLRGDEVVRQEVGTDLTAVVEGDAITVTGQFTGFDGPTQTGETSGEISITCGEDRDPGGGSLSLDGVEVAYDLVVCLETDDGYEVRAWDTNDDADQLAATRNRSATAWQDRIRVLGRAVADNEAPSSGDTAVEVTDGLFRVRGTRVTAEGAAFGPERMGSLEVTCGIDLSTATD